MQQIQPERPRHSMNDWIKAVCLLLLGIGVLGFFIWRTGMWGEVICWSFLVLVLLAGGVVVYILLAHHYLVLRNKNINSRVIVTPHVSVFAHREGHFTNFTAQLLPPKDEPLQFEQPETPPRDSWEQSKDRRAYALRTYDKKTWPQIAEEIGEGESWCRRAVDRHTGRLTRGETIDGRNW